MRCAAACSTWTILRAGPLASSCSGSRPPDTILADTILYRQYEARWLVEIDEADVERCRDRPLKPESKQADDAMHAADPFGPETRVPDLPCFSRPEKVPEAMILGLEGKLTNSGAMA